MVFMSNSMKPVPPDKGSFPLDHKGQCKECMKTFISCLETNKLEHHKCKQLSKQYLECRMNKNLMQHEDLNDYGFNHTVSFGAETIKKEKVGFVGGLTVKPK